MKIPHEALVSPVPAEARLVDARTGLLTAVVAHPPRPGIPPALVGYEAHVARTSAFATWQADRNGYGAAIADHARARGAAVGEAVERYCGNAVPSGLALRTWNDLARSGVDALDPQRLALFSARQHAQRGFPFTPFTRDLPVAWVAGRSLPPDPLAGAPVQVPASLAYLDYFYGARPREPATHPVPYSGIAAGRTAAQARRAALEELLERDATTLWWLSGAPARPLSGPGLPHHRLDDPEAGTRRYRFLLIPSCSPAPVVGALVEDSARGLLAFGSACRATTTLAAQKALVEALGLLSMTMQLADPDSELWRARGSEVVPEHTFVPFRPDRDYATAFGPNWRGLTDLPAVAQLYLDPTQQGEPLARLRTTAQPVDLRDAPSLRTDPDDDAAVLAAYLSALQAQGLHAVEVDLTTPDVRAAGLHVVRVIVAGLHGNAPAAYPYLGGERLLREPVTRGWVSGPLTEDDLVRQPLPLA